MSEYTAYFAKTLLNRRGGAGFIGSHLTERMLLEGHRVTIIDDFNAYYDPAIKLQN